MSTDVLTARLCRCGNHVRVEKRPCKYCSSCAPIVKRENVQRYRHNNIEKVREQDRLSAKRKRSSDPEGSRKRSTLYSYMRRKNDPVKARTESREAARRLREKNPEGVREAKRLWRLANPGKLAAEQSRRRARLRGNDAVGVTPHEWNQILEYFSDYCAYCLKTNVKLTRDHIEPLSTGGADNTENVVPSCLSCNSSKNSFRLAEWYGRKFS